MGVSDHAAQDIFSDFYVLPTGRIFYFVMKFFNFDINMILFTSQLGVSMASMANTLDSYSEVNKFKF